MFKKISLIIAFLLAILVIPSYNNLAIAISEDVSLDKVWTIRFNNEIDHNSVNEDTIYIEEYETGIKFPITYKTDLKKVQLLHDIPFDENTEYIIKIVNVADVNGNILKEPYEKEFKTKSELILEDHVINLDNEEMREKYGVESEGAYFYPLSYDRANREWVTYVMRTLVDKKTEAYGPQEYKIPEGVTFTRTLDVYSLLGPSEDLMIGLNLDNNLKLKDFDIYKKSEMEFTKDKPYWIERITWKKKPKKHTLVFAISQQDLDSQDEFLYRIQSFYEANISKGFRSGGINTGKDTFEFIDFEEILLNDMPEIMLHRDIFDYHDLPYSQFFTIMTNPNSRVGDKEELIKYVDNEYVYYNIVEYMVEAESYVYNTKTRNIEAIPNVIISSMDDNYIYGMENQGIFGGNDRIIRTDKDGKNLIYIDIPFVDELGNNAFKYPKLYGEYIYLIQDKYTDSKIIRMKKDGSSPEIVVDQYNILNLYYGEIESGGYEVNEHGIFFALEDGIYQYSHDGTRKQKLVSGDYLVDSWEDGFLYYVKSDAFVDYDLYEIETNYLESNIANPDPEPIPANNSKISIRYEDGKYNIYSNVSFSGTNQLYVDISTLLPHEYDLYTEEIFDIKFDVDGIQKGEVIGSIAGFDPGMHIYFRFLNEEFEGRPEYYEKVQYGGTGE